MGTRTVRTLPLLIVMLMLAIQAMSLEEIEVLRERAADMLIRHFPAAVTETPVIIVEIDEASLSALGQWPFPRDILAGVIKRLNAAGSLIAMTILTAEPDSASPQRVFDRMGIPPPAGIKLPDSDAILAQVVASGLAIGPAVMTNGSGEQLRSRSGFAQTGNDPLIYLPRFSRAIVPTEPIGTAYNALGAINMQTDRDGVLRWIPLLFALDGQLFPGFPTEVLRLAQGAGSTLVKTTGASGESGDNGIIAIRTGAAEIPTDKHGRLRFVPGPTTAIPRLSFHDILTGNVTADQLEGRIVVVGVNAGGIGERYTDPSGLRLTAMDVQAQVIEQILSGRLLTRPDWAPGGELLTTALTGILLIVACRYLGAVMAGLVGTGGLLAVLSLWFAAHQHYGMIVDPVMPVSTIIVTFLGVSLVERWVAERKSKWIRGAFASYVSPNLVNTLTRNPDALQLGGERKELSFVFTDLAGFTSLVEQLKPDELPVLLSSYLDGMTRITFRHDGTIDKFVGDAVHVIFGAPVDQPDHAQRALACAFEMQQFARAFAVEKNAAGIAVGETRIGVNTGPVVIGNFGGSTMFDYTAHGDAINTAARLESANKQFGTDLCVSEMTALHCPDFQGRLIGELILKGKTIPLKTYEPWSAENGPLPAAWQEYSDAYKLLESGTDDATRIFYELRTKYPADSLIAYHADRLTRGQTGSLLTLTEK
ncbi:MAG: adenylate/guanylate cyclase domain-containing protein [Rhodospirillales bacterium]